MKYRRKLLPDELRQVIEKVECVRDYYAARKTAEYYTALNFLEYLRRAYSLVRDDTAHVIVFYESAEISLFIEFQRIKNGRKP